MAVQDGASTPVTSRRRWPIGLVAAVVVYLWAAAGPILWYYVTDRMDLIADRPLIEHIIDHYDHLGALLYHLPAALTAWLLVRRSRHALWAGAVVAGWAAWTVFWATVHIARGGVEDAALILGGELSVLLVFTALLMAIRNWRTQNVLG